MTAISSITSATAAATAKAGAPDPKLLAAAKDFESIFVRQMLKGLEKTTAAGCGTEASAGEKTYGSMIVDTLSDSISKAGGLGLADVIARSMAATNPSLKASATPKVPDAALEAALIPPLKPLK
jgi:flagellar protein FlgJ